MVRGPDGIGRPVRFRTVSNHRQDKVLLIEDDAQLAPLVLRHLRDSGFEVAWAADGIEGLRLLREHAPELVVLDVMLPGEDGLSLCRRIRRDSDVGVIMVTARGQESDRILGLDLGADDYLPKPFSLWELEARIKAVLRRYAKVRGSAAARSFGPFVLDATQRSLSLRGERVELTRSAFELFQRLSAEPGRVYTREQLLDCVQGGDSDAFDRTVDTHISNLRRKLGEDPRAPHFVKTVWGVGYRFELP